MSYFNHINPIQQAGAAKDALAFRHYDPARLVLGKRMDEHLRLAVCYWHNFVWPGVDMFGHGTFGRPWHEAGEPMQRAREKAHAAFDFFKRLGTPFYTFHDTDVAPEGSSLSEYVSNLSAMVDVLAAKQAETGVKLLWGTANLFSHPRYAAGAASNPQPEVFACAATQVFHAMAATHRLGGANYVLWGGREGYDTLLNTDLKREREQLGRFFKMVVEHKHKIGFKGTILIEPKPQEPTKHQYDYDTATVYGFLKEFGLEQEVKVNLEANHATLAGHSFHHEVATSIALGLFGSIDANRGDPQNGWDTDQFPNSVEEMTLVIYEILRHGGFTTGGFNFDTKVRRQSSDPADLFHGHVGAFDTLAIALERAAKMIERDALAEFKAKRYAGWDAAFGKQILEGGFSLESLAQDAVKRDLRPAHVSGQQEHLENLVNAYIYS
ncbi:xylose isomerase [Dyella sp.]|uniref:xylose isomerase n=1 Tax=Dyella sp. TaxID=1869338 RepID=UPI002B47C89A|nr:xylose isomerase [Dyella sp.]HKT27445.1 xylose isomerase [Dyella sp.]